MILSRRWHFSDWWVNTRFMSCLHLQGHRFSSFTALWNLSWPSAWKRWILTKSRSAGSLWFCQPRTFHQPLRLTSFRLAGTNELWLSRAWFCVLCHFSVLVLPLWSILARIGHFMWWLRDKCSLACVFRLAWSLPCRPWLSLSWMCTLHRLAAWIIYHQAFSAHRVAWVKWLGHFSVQPCTNSQASEWPVIWQQWWPSFTPLSSSSSSLTE